MLVSVWLFTLRLTPKIFYVRNALLNVEVSARVASTSVSAFSDSIDPSTSTNNYPYSITSRYVGL